MAELDKDNVRTIYRTLVFREAERAGIDPRHVLDLAEDARRSGSVYWSRANGCRQLALYTAHTVFGIPIKPLAAAAGVSHQAVSRICHIIEDSRDDPEFDAWIRKFEAVVGD